ncbi:MAG: ATP-binding cassette domain-containing protein [Lachnospiraceae bacterium]|nr:ATP-binding cassette domain-containing protein [Lachnospiraceae bacterium]
MTGIRIENLTFTYKEASAPTLKDINLSIDKGAIALIIGESGSGKTTLIRQLKTTLTPYGERTGKVYINDIDEEALESKERVATIGYVGQNPEISMVTDRVYSELAFVMENLGEDNGKIRRTIAEVAHYFGLEELFLKKTNELSGGEKQLVSLASAMTTNPRVLLLDEPTAMLDPLSAVKLINVLKRINEEFGTTIVITEQRLEEIYEIADMVIVMKDGKVEKAGTPGDASKYLSACCDDNGLRNGLPAQIRLYKEASKLREGCPLTLKEGRIWFNKEFGRCTGKPCDCAETGTDITSKEEILKIDELAAGYKDKPYVLRNVDLMINKGEFICLLGGNGAGKSTILKALLREAEVTEGRFYYKGRKVKSLPLGKNEAVYLPQNPMAMFTEVTVKEEIESLYDNKLTPEDAISAEDALKKFRLEEFKDLHPYDLSGGQMQRLALAKALILNPDLLLIDEPTKGMDPGFKIEFASILNELKNSGKSILMVSHDVEFAARYADKCALLFDGEIADFAGRRQFFAGNLFYKTAVNSMVRDVLPNCNTVAEVMECIMH